MKSFAVAALLLLTACAGSGNPSPQEDEETLRQRLKELGAEVAAARVEIFDLRLKLARAEGKPEAESRCLREAGLRSPHEAVRQRAIRELAALEPERQKEFLDDLIEAARRDTPAARADAVHLLGRMPGTQSVVLEAAQDASPEVRRAAASALTVDHAPAVDALIGLIADPSREVRLAALETARTFPHERVQAAVLRVATEGPDPEIVEKAVDILGTLASPSFVGPILQILSSATLDSIRWSAINALGKIGASEAAPVIRLYLSGERPANLREVATQALGKLRDTVSGPPIAEALAKDPEARVRAAAARALGQIGGSAPIRDALLPATLGDRDPSVRQAAWDAALAAAGDRFVDLQLLSTSMLDRGRRTEAEAVCQRLHTLRLEGKELELELRIEDRAAEAAVAAQDYRAALSHLEVLRAARPGQPALLRKLARCHRELSDHDSAQKALTEALAAAEARSPIYWELKLDILATLEAMGEHARIVDEFGTPDSPPEPAGRTFAAACDRACAQLLRGLVSPDPAARVRAVESVRPLGKKIIGVLADAVTDASLPDRAGILEAGNAIAGTSFTDLSEPSEIAGAWRAWAQK